MDSSRIDAKAGQGEGRSHARVDSLSYAGRWQAFWFIDAAAMAASVLVAAIRPSTWRAPVREQFVACLDREGVGAVPAVAVIAGLTGLLLLSQGIFWLRELGQPDSVRALLLFLIMQQFAPLAVAVILLGRSALPSLGYLHGLWSDGAVVGLAVRGVGVVPYQAVPVCLALGTASACLTAVFVAVSAISGFVAAHLLGFTASGAGDTFLEIMSTLALSGPQWALLKSWLLGFVIGVVVFTTALAAPSRLAETGPVVARGFFRGLLAALTLNALLSVLGLL